MNFVDGVTLGVISILVYRFVLWAIGFEIRKKRAYSFECTRCDFGASANDLHRLTLIRTGHSHSDTKIMEE